MQISEGRCLFLKAAARDGVATCCHLAKGVDWTASFSPGRHCIQLKLSHVTFLLYLS